MSYFWSLQIEFRLVLIYLSVIVYACPVWVCVLRMPPSFIDFISLSAHLPIYLYSSTQESTSCTCSPVRTPLCILPGEMSPPSTEVLMLANLSYSVVFTPSCWFPWHSNMLSHHNRTVQLLFAGCYTWLVWSWAWVNSRFSGLLTTTTSGLPAWLARGSLAISGGTEFCRRCLSSCHITMA